MSPLPPWGSGGRDPGIFFAYLIQNPAFFGCDENGHYQCFYQDLRKNALGEMKTVGRGPKIEAEGQERGGVLQWGGAAKAPPVRGSGERCELPRQGSGRSPDRPNFLKLFSALRMASPDIV